MEEMLQSFQPSPPVSTIESDSLKSNSPQLEEVQDSPLEVIIHFSDLDLSPFEKVNSEKEYWEMINGMINEEDIECFESSPEPIRSKPRSTKKIHFGPELVIIPVFRLLEPLIGWVGPYNRKTKRNPDIHYGLCLSNEVGEKEIVDFEEYTANQEAKRESQGGHCWEAKDKVERFISTYPSTILFDIPFQTKSFICRLFSNRMAKR